MAVAAFVVSILALLFTVGTFWWMNVRRGDLTLYSPSSFGACVTAERTMFRLPLVFFNTGAPSTVVLNLRLRILDSSITRPLQWHTTHEGLASSEHPPMAAAFVVPGRTAVRVFAGFAEGDTGDFILGRELTAVVDAELGHKDGWQELVRFPLLAQGVRFPMNFIAYSNCRGQIPDDAPAVSAQELEKLRAGRRGTSAER